MSNNIPVNGWPQLKDLEAVQPILNRLDKIEAWKRTVKEETFTGDDITVENALALPARSLTTEIGAIQDLHGYDHPWAGGAYKNQFDIDNPQSSSGWTISSGVLTGSNNNYAAFISNKFKGNGTMWLSEKVTASTADYVIQVRNVTDNVEVNRWTISAGSGQSLANTFNAVSGKEYEVRYFGTSATSGTISISEIQVEEGSSATSFAPYSNICPISGRDSVAVNYDGNLASPEFEQGGINGPIVPVVSYNSQKIAMSTRIRTKNLIYLPVDTEFTIDCDSSIYDFVAQSYDADGLCVVTAYPYNRWTSERTVYKSKGSFAIAIRHKDNSDISLSELSNVHLRICLTHTNVTIQFGTTVYGADINWDTGVASVLRRAYDMGELNYEYLSDNNAFRSTSPLPDATTENVFINSISSIYNEHQTGMANMTDGEFRVQGGIIYLKDFRFTSASDLKTALSGQTVVYDIATPSTIQLTPTQLEMLKGYNHITLSDGYGTIELKALTGANWS